MRFALTQIAADERRHQVLLSGISAALPPPRMDPEFAARMRRFFMRLAHHWTAVRGPLYRPVWQQGVSSASNLSLLLPGVLLWR